jgi:hypothetical protein
VVHDYGMGADYWWVHAASPAEIVETCAGVQVVTDPATRQLALGWNLEEYAPPSTAPAWSGAMWCRRSIGLVAGTTVGDAPLEGVA